MAGGDEERKEAWLVDRVVGCLEVWALEEEAGRELEERKKEKRSDIVERTGGDVEGVGWECGGGPSGESVCGEWCASSVVGEAVHVHLFSLWVTQDLHSASLPKRRASAERLTH